MIKKLRKKFIIVSLLSVFALLTAILLVINLINFSLVTEDADRVLEQMIVNGGEFPEGFIPGMDQTQANGENGFQNGSNAANGGSFDPRGPKGPDSPELGQTTRYFTVTFGADGSVVDVKMQINAVSQEKAVEWARSLMDKKNGWTKTYYRYRVWSDGDRISVTVIDQSRELLPSYRVLVASCVGGAVGLLVTLVVLLFVSKTVTEPVERSDRKQKRFIQDASFELKNPIVAIDASRETLEGRIGETEETALIAKEVGHLTKVVQGLDTLLLLEEPQRREKSEIDLSLLVKEAVAPYREALASQGKTMTLTVQEGVRSLGDPASTEKLIGIALKNGSDYAETHFEVKLTQEGDRVVMEFINDAAGLEDGPMDSVFERFYRSPEVRQSMPDGAGLGLSIAKEIVDLNGGRIRAEAKNGFFRLKIEL